MTPRGFAGTVAGKSRARTARWLEDGIIEMSAACPRRHHAICSIITLCLATQLAGAFAAMAEDSWTAVTISRSSVGSASSSSLSEAIALAIRDCRSRSEAVSDCGAELKTTRTGHIVAARCGDYRALAAAKTAEEAEAALSYRILQLRFVSNAALGPCVLVLKLRAPNSLSKTASPHDAAM